MDVRGVSSYGAETRVDDSSISRLSFYLKCCTVGCGLAMDIDSILLDYHHIRHHPGQLHRIIYELVANDLSPEHLLNRAYFLDDNHTLLPLYVSNAFFAIEAASNFTSVERLLISGQRFQIHKVMLCTTDWLEDYYFKPLQRLRQAANTQNSTLSGSLQISFHCTHCRGISDVCACESVCPVVLVQQHARRRGGTTSQCRALHRGIACSASCDGQNGISGHRFRCRSCRDINLCESCYDGGAHDHTHAFDKFDRLGSFPASVPPRACLIEAVSAASLVSSDYAVPTAEAVPINECKVCDDRSSSEQQEYSANAFWPGQAVRLIGLSKVGMNGRTAMVASVNSESIHIRLQHVLEAAEIETYLVKPENLASVDSETRGGAAGSSRRSPPAAKLR